MSNKMTQYLKEKLILEEQVLRDRFAMAALPAIIDAVLATEPNGNSAEQCARLSYAMANAMLEARK